MLYKSELGHNTAEATKKSFVVWKVKAQLITDGLKILLKLQEPSKIR